ncbi:hypothetical protein D3C71_24590 [compost metagenome]
MKNFFARLRAGAAITINGRHFAGARNVTIQDGRIYVDGAEQSMDSSAAMNVSIQGDVEALEVGYGQVTVAGPVNRLTSASGDVRVDGAVGSVQTASGDVVCGDVHGDVSTASGDIRAASVAGGARSMSGDIHTR